MAAQCRVCANPIRGNAAAEDYDEVTQTMKYTCRGCARQFAQLTQEDAPMTTTTLDPKTKKVTGPVWYGPAPSNQGETLMDAWVVRADSSRGRILARFAVDGRDACERWIYKHCPGSCTVVRTILQSHGHFNFNENKLVMERQQWVTEPCGTPLFGVARKASGQCAGCARGWNHPNNYRADGPRPEAEVNG